MRKKEEQTPVPMINENPGIALLFSDIDTDVAQEVCEWIISENLDPEPNKVLTLLVNSLGGDLSAAFAMIELMNASSIPIQTVAIGEVCSAGLIVAMSGTKGLRVVTPSCSIMSHNFSTTTSGSYHELKEANVELDKADRMIIDQYKKCTGLSEKVIRSKLVTPKDIYLTPADAVKYKLFDSVSPLKIGVLNNL